MSKRLRWKKFRPDSNEELETALMQEKRLTTEWYQRMSGQVPWKPGERELFKEKTDSITSIANRLLSVKGNQ